MTFLRGLDYDSSERVAGGLDDDSSQRAGRGRNLIMASLRGLDYGSLKRVGVGSSIIWWFLVLSFLGMLFNQLFTTQGG